MTVWTSLSMSFIYLSFKGWVWQEEFNHELTLKKIIEEREQLNQRLLLRETSNTKLANNAFEYSLVKRLLQGYANDINQALQDYQKSLTNSKKLWKQLMSDLDSPFQNNLHVSIALNRRLTFNSGPRLLSEFGKSWNRNILRLQHDITNNKNIDRATIELLKLTKEIFSLPMDPGEYQESIGKCQLIFHFKTKSYIYFYNYRLITAKGDQIDLVLVIPANALTSKVLKKAIQYDLISRYSNISLKTSKSDYIRLANGNHRPVTLDTGTRTLQNGILYQPEYTKFTEYCSQHLILIILLVLPGLIVTCMGGVRAFKYHFEWTLLLIFLFSLSVSYLLIDQFFFQAREQKRISILMDTKELVSNSVNKLEARLKDYLSSLEEEATRVTKAPYTLNSSKLPTGAILLKITSNYKLQTLFKGKEINRLQEGILQTAALTILTMQREWNTHLTDAQYSQIWEDKSSLEKLLVRNKSNYPFDVRDYDIFDFNPDSYLAFIQHNKLSYGKDYAETFNFVPLFQKGYYFFWRKDFDNRRNLKELYIIGIPGPEFLNGFMTTSKYFNEGFDGNVKWYVKDNKLKQPSVNQLNISEVVAAKAIDRGRAQVNRLLKLEVAETAYLYQYITSDQFPGYEFLALIDQAQVMEPYHKLNISYKRFIPFYFLIGILVGLLISRQILNPIQKLQGGFDQLQKDDYTIQLKTESQDESRKLLEQFNQMVDELHQRDAMRPFVSDAATHLFKLMIDGKDYIESNGAVVFADIRSFTTISENYSPEEIVDMLNDYFTLWQGIVEKHDGIIDRFIGDAISIVFLEEAHSDYIQRAISTSIELMKAMPEFNQNRESQNKFTVKNGIGIAQSKVTFAIVGTEEKQEFFIYGDAPDLAENLEAESKKGVHSNIIVDSNVYEAESNYCKFTSFDACDPQFGQCYEIIFDDPEREKIA